MLSDAERDCLTRQLVTLRVVVVSLCAGVLLFAVIALIVHRGVAEEPRLAFGALLVSVGCVIAAAIVPRVIGRRAESRPADRAGGRAEVSSPGPSDGVRRVSQLMGTYQGRLLVSVALLEAAAFLNLVAYLIEGQLVNVLVALVLLVLMLIQYPSRARTEEWIAGELRIARPRG